MAYRSTPRAFARSSRKQHREQQYTSPGTRTLGYRGFRMLRNCLLRTPSLRLAFKYLRRLTK
jgi:hypothetical protein